MPSHSGNFVCPSIGSPMKIALKLESLHICIAFANLNAPFLWLNLPQNATIKASSGKPNSFLKVILFILWKISLSIAFGSTMHLSSEVRCLAILSSLFFVDTQITPFISLYRRFIKVLPPRISVFIVSSPVATNNGKSCFLTYFIIYVA